MAKDKTPDKTEEDVDPSKKSGKQPSKKSGKQPSKKSGNGDLTAHQREDLVQITGKIVRSTRSKPDVAVLGTSVGFAITSDQRDTAYEEMRSRSEDADHSEIVSKARWSGK